MYRCIYFSVKVTGSIQTVVIFSKIQMHVQQTQFSYLCTICQTTHLRWCNCQSVLDRCFTYVVRLWFPWMMHPLDNTSLGRYVLLTLRPLDEMSHKLIRHPELFPPLFQPITLPSFQNRIEQNRMEQNRIEQNRIEQNRAKRRLVV